MDIRIAAAKKWIYLMLDFQNVYQDEHGIWIYSDESNYATIHLYTKYSNELYYNTSFYEEFYDMFLLDIKIFEELIKDYINTKFKGYKVTVRSSHFDLSTILLPKYILDKN